jgi:hypothetical protein
MSTHMCLANRLESINAPSFPLSDLHNFAERTAPNDLEKLKRVDSEGWALGVRIRSRALFYVSNGTHNRRSIGDTHLDLACAANNIIPFVDNRLINKSLV